MAEKEKEKEPNDRLQRSAQHPGLRVLGQSKLPKLKEHQEEERVTCVPGERLPREEVRGR